MTQDIKRGPHMDDCPGMGGCSGPSVPTKDDRIAELEAERDALAAALKKHARHLCSCPAHPWTWAHLPNPCNCGLAQALANPAAILAARDARMKREGKMEALEGLPMDKPRPRHADYSEDSDWRNRCLFCDGWNAYRDRVVAAIAALEKEGRNDG